MLFLALCGSARSQSKDSVLVFGYSMMGFGDDQDIISFDDYRNPTRIEIQGDTIQAIKNLLRAEFLRDSSSTVELKEAYKMIRDDQKVMMDAKKQLDGIINYMKQNP